MSGEAVAGKAQRLLDEERVQIVNRSDDLVVADVEGDHATYRVTLTTDGTFRGCTCPATTICSHIIATEQETGMTYANHDALAADVVVDPETGEILTGETPDDLSGHLPTDLGDAQSVPDAEVVPAVVADTTLLPVADAPITDQTLRYIAQTQFVPASLRGRPEAILACVLFGRSMGLDPMQALAHVHVIDGQPQPSAQLLGRLIRAAGHTVEVVEMTDRTVRLRGTRADTGETLEVEYTVEAAERAGLVEIDGDGNPRARSRQGNPMPWELFTDDMLWARALSKLHRRLFQDVTQLDPDVGRNQATKAKHG